MKPETRRDAHSRPKPSPRATRKCRPERWALDPEHGHGGGTVLEGRSIEASCNEQALDWRARTEIVARVCDAVQAAHDRDERFGIAETLFGAGHAATTVDFSIDGDWVEFLAPEQTGSNDLTLDGRADVYALAVLAHRLLTGAAPHDESTIRRSARMGMLDWMYRDGPLRASDRYRLRAERGDALASASGCTRRELERVLRDRFDEVLATALSRDPSERTPSPAHLARDLRKTTEPARPRRLPSSTSLSHWWTGLRKQIVLRAD